MCVCVRLPVEGSDPMELELQSMGCLMWVLRIDCRSFGRAVLL